MFIKVIKTGFYNKSVVGNNLNNPKIQGNY